ncbi:hypothetical protein MUN78_03055 [Leucobacter allii]|uniref:Integral membrane protein n=1 Tax=Leucobacter allii TaxID=2932247 RepID=A0ABY4FNK7_9MICO|nr:hypothetical protein [Leucobacter allii]UOQ57831.1 hypothetical protein MUN78_03055 [Leucobacter allii]
MAQSDADLLATEIAELKADNAALARELEQQRACGDAGPRKRGARPRRLARGALATALILVGAVLAPVAVVSTWAHHQLTDTSFFVDTFAPLSHEPAVQDLVAAEVIAAIESEVDIDQIADDLFAGLGSLELGPRAVEALDLLEAPAVAGVKSLMRNTIHEFVASDAFSVIWRDALEVTHRQLVNTAAGTEDAAITIGQNQQLQLELGPVLQAVKTELVADGIPLAEHIPVIDRSIVLAEDTSIDLYLTVYQMVVATGIWLPWIMLLMLTAGVLIAPRRTLALAWASGGVLLAMVLTGNGLDIGTDVFALAVAHTVPHDAAVVLYDGVLGFVSDLLVALGTVAAVVLAVTLIAGPWPWARTLRGLVLGLIADRRRGMERRGITTGAFGERLAHWRRPLRFGVGAACAAFVLLVRPLTPAMTLWLTFLSVAAVLTLELLSRPAGETPHAELLETRT